MHCNIYTDSYQTRMVKMMDNYAASKTKLVSCCRMMMTAITIFSFFFGLSMLGEVSVAAGSISSSQIGGQEFEEEEQQQQQQLPQICSSVTAGTNANTTKGIVGADNNNTITSSLYENPEYGIQILCPDNWVYLEEENPFTGDFQVTFMSLTEALEFGSALESEVTPEVAPIVGVLISQVPFANLDLQVFADLNIRDLTSSGYEIIRTNLNATLSGMPAWEVVYVDANGTMFLQDWTVQGDRAYAVMYASHESRFNQFLPTARDMISSFTITNDTRSTTSTTLTSNNGNNTTPPGHNTSNTTQFQTPSESPSTTTSTTATEGNNQGMSLEAAKKQYLTVWNQTEFQIAFNTYIEPGSATGYGIYEEHANNNIFRPGETIELYLEPAAFGHQQIRDDNGNTLYLMDLTADIILSDVNGNEIFTFEDAPIETMVSHRQNTEMHLTLTVTQSQPFPVGDYIVTYVVHDQVKEESFQIDKEITIANVVDDGNAGNTTANVQQEQQQQQQQGVEWLPYENATYGVRMLYPSTWIQQDGTVSGDEGIIVISQFSTPEEEIGSYASVLIVIETPQSTNIEGYLNDSIDSFIEDPTYTDFQVLSSNTGNFSLAGMPAYSLEATYTNADFGPQHLLEVGTIIDNKGYFIQYQADPPVYRTYFPIVERMIESFEIMQQ
jgi:hypothetical protein